MFSLIGQLRRSQLLCGPGMVDARSRALYDSLYELLGCDLFPLPAEASCTWRPVLNLPSQVWAEDLQVLWEDGDRVFCRGSRASAGGGRGSLLVVLLAAEHPSSASVKRLDHEYGLKDELDEAWAVRPLELGRHNGRIILVLEDRGGEPLEQMLGSPLEVGRFLHLAIGIVAALGKAHQRGLIHNDIKPANVLGTWRSRGRREAIPNPVSLTSPVVWFTAKNAISVNTQLAEGLPLVWGVRVRLQQVILNLIINAIDAMSSVGEGPRQLLIKTVKSESGSISVAVQDTGPGLGRQNLERAFEAFYATKPDGGLGLSICRSIVEAHGGRLAMTANVPRGAIFQFAIPAREDKQSAFQRSAANGAIS